MESEAAQVETGLTIADAARATGLSVHTLRYHERAGLIGDVDRASSRHRRYSQTDLAWVRTILCLRATAARGAPRVGAGSTGGGAGVPLLRRTKIATYKEQIDE